MGYDQVRIAYAVREPAGGANENLSPILFLHGAFVSKEYWNHIPQVVADKTKRRVYSLDARNHGDSDWSDVFNFDVNAQDVLNFMDSKSITKAVLIGHSMGGISTVKVALAHPERVEMAFIEDMFVKRVPIKTLKHVVKIVQLFEEAVAHIPIDLDEKAANQFVLNYVAGNKAVTNALGNNKREMKTNLVIPLKRDINGKYTLKTNMKVLINTLQTEETAMLENKGMYEGPAYFIYGTWSSYKVNKEENHIRKYFPNAQLIGMEGSNHDVHLNLPEKFTEEILKHLLNKENNISKN